MGEMLRRKYERKHVYQLYDKQLKNCSKQLKTIMNDTLKEDIN